MVKLPCDKLRFFTKPATLLILLLLAFQGRLWAQQKIYFTMHQAVELTVSKYWEMVENDFDPLMYDTPNTYLFKDSSNAYLVIFDNQRPFTLDSAIKYQNINPAVDSVVYLESDMVECRKYDSLKNCYYEVYICTLPYNICIIVGNQYSTACNTYIDRIKKIKYSMR